MDKDNKLTLQHCLDNTYKVHGILNNNKIWYSSGDTMLTVATILDDEGIFIKTTDVIRFFEKPWKWESDMQELIDEYNEENKPQVNEDYEAFVADVNPTFTKE